MLSKAFKLTLFAVICWTAPQLKAANLLVRVDLQAPINNWGGATGAEPLAVAQSSSFGSDSVDYWNTASFQGVFTPPNGPYNLKDSSDLLGPAGLTVAVFTVNTNTVAITSGKLIQPDALRHDFWQVGSSTPVEWNISGLIPGGSYEMVFYTGMPAFPPALAFGATIQLDADGQNANLELSQVVNYVDGAFYFPAIVADASGVIHGSFGEVPGQFPGTGTWSGFQLSGPGVPEPTTSVLAGLMAMATLVVRRHR
jgi:hypothetical protein